jgi:branched-chain amino acid aminotransferase
MHKNVYHNDRLLPLQEVRLSPGQAGLLAGWGVFTTLRIYDGQPFAFDRHWQRLAADAERIQLPLIYRPEAIRAHLAELLRANRVAQGCVRIYFILNKFGIWGSDEPMPPIDLLMYSTDLPGRVGPVRLCTMAHRRHAANPLTGTKVTSWLNNVLSLELAHQRGFEEVILLNELNQVTECTAANLFCVHKGEVSTPPLDSGCLPGVSRQILLEIGPPAGIPMVERPLTVKDLYSAHELFISSTTREVQPVSYLESFAYPQPPGPITRKLAEMFSEYVKQDIARAAAAAR